MTGTATPVVMCERENGEMLWTMVPKEEGIHLARNLVEGVVVFQARTYWIDQI